MSNVSIYPCPSTYIVDFYYTHMCFVFHLLFYYSRVLGSLFCIVASYKKILFSVLFFFPVLVFVVQ